MPGRENRTPKHAGVDHRLERDDIGLQPVLKEDAELDAGAIGGGDELVGLGRGDVERLLDEHVQAALDGRDP